MTVDRISDIKLQVMCGTYKIDPEKVAIAMIENERRHQCQMPYEDECEIRALQYEGYKVNQIARMTKHSPAAVSNVLALHFRPAIPRGRSRLVS